MITLDHPLPRSKRSTHFLFTVFRTADRAQLEHWYKVINGSHSPNVRVFVRVDNAYKTKPAVVLCHIGNDTVPRRIKLLTWEEFSVLA